jgi:uncharacterized protein
MAALIGRISDFGACSVGARLRPATHTKIGLIGLKPRFILSTWLMRGMMANCFQNLAENRMVNPELLEILRCPACVREKNGLLTLTRDTWLICQDCGRKYPIVDEIPVMLIEEGDKWQATAVEDLPVPAPAR